MPECQFFFSPLFFKLNIHWPGLLQNPWPGILQNEWPGILRNHWQVLVQNSQYIPKIKLISKYCLNKIPCIFG